MLLVLHASIPLRGGWRILRAFALCRRPPIWSYVFTAYDSRCQRRDILIIVVCIVTVGMLSSLSGRACCFCTDLLLAFFLFCCVDLLVGVCCVVLICWLIISLVVYFMILSYPWLFISYFCVSCVRRTFDACFYSCDDTF